MRLLTWFLIASALAAPLPRQNRGGTGVDPAGAGEEEVEVEHAELETEKAEKEEKPEKTKAGGNKSKRLDDIMALLTEIKAAVVKA
jgi:hypothetical protein